ncbi:MAG: MATE family efflux transporter [Bacillota bacterium]|nr:MATE family efflux transporter [Bacillota bacterium]
MNDLSAPTNATGRFRRIFIGDRVFYKTVLMLVVPIVVQNVISNFVNLLDNVMVGQVGTVQMSGVAIANQLIFVFNLTIFGGLSGPGIFGAQFYGAGDNEGLRSTFRFKLITAAVVLAAAVTVFTIYSKPLISLYLTGKGNTADAGAMLRYGRDYLKVMLWGLPPFALSQVYSGTLREMGEAVLPMKASLAAVFTNLCFNYVLIYGKFGFPMLGVVGAAIATVISRYVEISIIAIYTHRSAERFPFITGMYRTLNVPRALALNIFRKGTPLLVNELLWSIGVTTLTQIFSTCGLNVVAGLNISSVVINLFNVVYLSMGTAVAVIIGQALGAGEIRRAKEDVWKLIFFSICLCLVVGAILSALAPFIPYIYNTTDEVRRMATLFMITNAFYMVFNATTNCCYFTLRSGGKTFVTFLFDSVYTWVVCVPYTFAITHFSGLDIYVIYPICYLVDILKSVIGVLVLRTGYWAQNFVAESADADLAKDAAKPG